MAFYDNEMQFEDATCETIVKNTFLTWSKPLPCTPRRLKSVPASMRLCLESGGLSYDEKSFSFRILHFQSEASTTVCSDVCTEASFDDEGTSGDSDVGFSFDASPDSPVHFRCPSQSHGKNVLFSSSGLSTQPVPPKFSGSPIERMGSKERLNSKAPAFEPKTLEEPLKLQQYQHHFEKVIKTAVKALRGSDVLASVGVQEDRHEWCITIQVNSDGQMLSQQVLAAAQQELLKAAESSKSIFVVGFSSPSAFVPNPQGFQCTLGAMENARHACWHLFKKGFCRHGGTCSKQHPVCEMPVRVLVETAHFDAPLASINDFKLQVADLIGSTVASLEQNPHVSRANAWKNTVSKCWTVELSPKHEDVAHQEHLVTLAKHAIFSATDTSNTVCLMGKSAKPFVPKHEGFVAMLGSAQPESRRCWDFYSSGACRRHCTCRWEHPKCIMPITFSITPSHKTMNLSELNGLREQ